MISFSQLVKLWHQRLSFDNRPQKKERKKKAEQQCHCINLGHRSEVISRGFLALTERLINLRMDDC